MTFYWRFLWRKTRPELLINQDVLGRKLINGVHSGAWREASEQEEDQRFDGFKSRIF